MDRAVSVTWYDLPTEAEEEYFAWLHGTYAPKMRERPGVLWVAHYKTDKSVSPLPILRHTRRGALPGGTTYLFLIGARDAHVLADLTPFRLDGKRAAKERRMLALREGARSSIFTEEARVSGPAAKQREGRWTPAPCIQLGSFNAGAWQDEDELLSWYAHLRLPSIATMPGALGLRKWVSVSGWAKHGVMYEFTSLEARARHFRAHEARNPKQAAWTRAVIAKLVHAPGSPNVAERLWPPVPASRGKPNTRDGARRPAFRN